jgi:hypothetical protein
MELNRVSQQEVVEKSLTVKEEKVAIQQSSGAIREVLKVWETSP